MFFDIIIFVRRHNYYNFTSAMGRNSYSIEDVKIAVAENKSVAGVLRQIGQGWNIGLQFNPKPVVTDDAVFVKDSNYKCTWRLRERYKKVTHIGYCENCQLTEWQGKPIPLEIHHINGINTDNRLENLQLLCPNCHALTDNYRGRAHLSALSERRDVECRKFKETRPSGDGRQS